MTDTYIRRAGRPRTTPLFPTPDGVESIVVLSDIHIPYHDPAAVEVAFQIVDDLQPQRIIILGDLIDFYQISSYDVDPARATGYQLQSDLHAAQAFLQTLRSIVEPVTQINYILGNHEDRLRKFLWKTPKICGLESLALESLLNLAAYNITMAPNSLLRSNMLFEHGSIIRKGSGYTAHAQLSTRGISGISGHSHRLSTIYHTDLSGVKLWAENGHLSTMQPEYLQGQPDWQQGGSVLWLGPQTLPVIQQFHIHQGTCLFAGRTYKA